MTAAAAAPVSGPIAPVVSRPLPQATADPFAFGAMLDSLPGAPAKADASTAEDQPNPSDKSLPEGSSHGQTARRSLLNDSALLAALPFALRAGSMMGENTQAAASSPSVASPALSGSTSEESGASLAVGAKTSTVGRLVGERAFHLSPSAIVGAGAIASATLAGNRPSATDAASVVSLTARPTLNDESALAAGFSSTEVIPAKASVDAVPPPANAASPTPTVSRASAPHRVSTARAAAHEATSSLGKPDAPTPPSVARVETSAAAHASREWSGQAAGGLPADLGASAAPSAPQTTLFDASLSAPFSAGTSIQLDGSTPSTGQTDVTPRATTAGSAPSAPPVREIDVDLSPGGLEDVSMTMRLTGDKLSVVIRAASSQTLGSIEGARDAIADRMAAIGQPLDSLIVKQAGVNTEGNANGNKPSADGGSLGGERRSAQGAGDYGGSNDALSRRGAGRDRSF